MDGPGQKHELWGTFSVWDHVQPGAFLAEVVMYDRLVIPVPPNPDQAQTPEDHAFAREQWTRWERAGWQPERMRALLDVVRPVAEPIEWDREHHEQWQQEYAEYESGSPAAANLVARIMAGRVTAQVLLRHLPAKAAGAVAVAPFTSLDDLKRELGITDNDGLVRRQAASRGLPDSMVSAVVGREFLVPSDPDRDEFYLLREAVDLVQQQDYRMARAAFHAAMLSFADAGRTDFDSVRTAVEAMETQLATLDQLARRRRVWNALRRAFFFAQVATDLAAAPINPVAAGRAAISIGQFTTTELLANPADPNQPGPAGALLHDAQRKLKLTLQGERRTDS
jgi:hypothetical protein